MSHIGPDDAVVPDAAAEVTVAVIAKTPAPGRVKTRLCPPCSPTQAAQLAAAALADTLDAVLSPRCGASRRVLVLDGDPGPWVPAGVDVIAQRGEGLDQRLAATFEDLGAPTVVVGMDTPQLTPEDIAEVVRSLRDPDVDAVLGPATDGGYWTIALRALRDGRGGPGVDPAAALVGVPMSETHTHLAQLDRLRSLGLRVAEVGELRDVDTFSDALAVLDAAPDGRFASAVRATLDAMAGDGPAQPSSTT